MNKLENMNLNSEIISNYNKLFAKMNVWEYKTIVLKKDF